MRAITYVEGKSDKLALKALLRPLIEQKMNEGVGIHFFESPSGDRKASLLRKVPRKAVGILRSDPHAEVIVLPDLYPPNKAFPHQTFAELRKGIRAEFTKEMNRLGVTDTRISKRFHVHCLKHDLEVLLLAAAPTLLQYVELDESPVSWTDPVEDQNHDTPPKHIVELLFGHQNTHYWGTIDAPRILESANLQYVVANCPQCFGPYVNFLENASSRYET